MLSDGLLSLTAWAKARQVQLGLELETRFHREGIKPVCSLKCPYCCSYPLLITLVEGLILYESLRPILGHFRGKLLEHHGYVFGLDLKVWLLAEIPCPLLIEHLCTAYKVRPMSCRMLHSIGDPLRCKSGTKGKILYDSSGVANFNLAIKRKLDNLYVSGTLLPVSTAILLAHAIHSGKIPETEVAEYLTKNLHG